MAHFSHHLMTALPAPLLPLIRNNFALNYTQSGWVVSVFSLSYGFGQLPGGWLADRLGPRILITVGICGVALVGFLVGLSQTYIMLIALLALMGLIGGGYHPSAAPLISASVKPKKSGAGTRIPLNWWRCQLLPDTPHRRCHCYRLGMARLIHRISCPRHDIRNHILHTSRPAIKNQPSSAGGNPLP